ncbi:MAG: NAD(P)-binding protein, partial [Chthoniobacterales bacterium]|nr:NAD(P)-binding protein [Chthoniobacterales bacterium]
MAVLGAGLSGTAAAHLLKDEGATVTVLDSAEEKTILKTTIEGLRARGIEVICGPEAERDAARYEMVVLSPGIDPASPLGKNFVAREVEILGELELGWRSCNAPVVA